MHFTWKFLSVSCFSVSICLIYFGLNTVVLFQWPKLASNILMMKYMYLKGRMLSLKL